MCNCSIHKRKVLKKGKYIFKILCNKINVLNVYYDYVLEIKTRSMDSIIRHVSTASIGAIVVRGSVAEFGRKVGSANGEVDSVH